VAQVLWTSVPIDFPEPDYGQYVWPYGDGFEWPTGHVFDLATLERAAKTDLPVVGPGKMPMSQWVALL
jgi:hypothetical protein